MCLTMINPATSWFEIVELLKRKTCYDRYISELWSTHVLGERDCVSRVLRVLHVLPETGGEQKLVEWSW
jgi:hypothetical protein